MFIGRRRELAALEKQYRSGKFEFTVIYGRRRVGKTAIINEFVKDKEVVYFTGFESNEEQNLRNFSDAVLSAFPAAPAGAGFRTFQDALESVFIAAREKRLILVIDEYPYVAKASRSLASTLQLLIDREKSDSKLFLILCGSSMSYMEDHVLAYKAPLYGRRTAQIKVSPFSFTEAGELLSPMSAEDRCIAYGILGGTPQYLLQFDPSRAIKENLMETFLNPDSFLYEEPSNLLKQEVREPAVYNAAISAIAGGASRLSEIASKMNETTAACSGYLKSLISLGIVRKETPFGEPSSRKTIYSIEDPMFRFWYRFVSRSLSLIERGAAEIAYRNIEPFLNEYMGPAFEEICKQHLWQLLLRGEAPVDFTELGRWWGTDPKTKKQEEIDIVCANQASALFCECKWTSAEVGASVLETLVRRGELLPYEDRRYALFSRSGFTSGCVSKSKEQGRVSLFTLEDLA